MIITAPEAPDSAPNEDPNHLNLHNANTVSLPADDGADMPTDRAELFVDAPVLSLVEVNPVVVLPLKVVGFEDVSPNYSAPMYQKVDAVPNLQQLLAIDTSLEASDSLAANPDVLGYALSLGKFQEELRELIQQCAQLLPEQQRDILPYLHEHVTAATDSLAGRLGSNNKAAMIDQVEVITETADQLLRNVAAAAETASATRPGQDQQPPMAA